MKVLQALTPEFRDKVEVVVAGCSKAGFEVVPYQGWRSPAEQARLWRQSRSDEQVAAEVKRLRQLGASSIAELILQAPAEPGPHVTNAVPGRSWHQFGRAADCYVRSPRTGRVLWRERGRDGDEFGLATQLYRRFGEFSESFGLTWGGRWSIGDYGHIQDARQLDPVRELGWAEVDGLVVQSG